MLSIKYSKTLVKNGTNSKTNGMKNAVSSFTWLISVQEAEVKDYTHADVTKAQLGKVVDT